MRNASDDTQCDFQFQLELADACGWIEIVAAAIASMDASRWGQFTSLLHASRPSFASRAEQSRAAWEEELSAHDDRLAARAQATRSVDELESLLRQFEGRLVWRLGLALRSLLGLLGLKKSTFRMPSADARVAIAQFRHSVVLRTAAPRMPWMPSDAPAGGESAPPIFSEGLYAETLRRIFALELRPAVRFAHEVSTAGIGRLYAQRTNPGGTGLISVVMPTYNRAFVIAEAVQSVLEQTWTNWELLVCDDGSTDNTKQILETFSDPRITHLPLPHRGAAAARNAGLLRARGALVAFLDTDNLWHPYYLDAMHDVLAATPSAPFAYATYVDVVEHDGAPVALRPLRPRYFSFEQLAECNYIDLNTSVYRREALQALGGFDERLGRFQDWDLALRHAFGKRPAYLNLALCIYRRSTRWNQISQNKKSVRTAEQIVAENLAARYAATAETRESPKATGNSTGD